MSSSRMSLIVAALVAAAGLVAWPRAAAAADDALPTGSWQQTCQQGYVRNGVLHAQCRREGGEYVNTTAQLGSCAAFGNRNGALFCESAGDGTGQAGQGQGQGKNQGHGQGKSQGKNQGKNQGKSHSQDDDDDQNPAVDSGQWTGSFLDSCRDISVDKHGRLNALCLRENGAYRRTNLQPQRCRSYVAGNRDGTLVCESTTTDSAGSTGSTGYAGQWRGSFQNSCRDVSTDANGTLTANCQKANGDWHRSSLATRDCSGLRAGNRDGTLVCESTTSGGGFTGQWRGSFQNSCRDVSTDANGTLTANCQKANGDWHRSSLATRNCSGLRAGNRDGTLVCER